MLAVFQIEPGALFGIILVAVIAAIGIWVQVDAATAKTRQEEEFKEQRRLAKEKKNQEYREGSAREEQSDEERYRQKQVSDEERDREMRPILEAAIARGEKVCWTHYIVGVQYCNRGCGRCLCLEGGPMCDQCWFDDHDDDD
ncbi:MAG: hypothetical protein WCT33_01590 [Patescibacteria group bacterium]|jgi:sensor c-di-GMP phosphodiesterase-like protein